MPGSLKRKLSAGGAAHTWYVQPLFCRVEVLYGGEASLSAAGRVHIRGMYCRHILMASCSPIGWRTYHVCTGNRPCRALLLYIPLAKRRNRLFSARYVHQTRRRMRFLCTYEVCAAAEDHKQIPTKPGKGVHTWYVQPGRRLGSLPHMALYILLRRKLGFRVPPRKIISSGWISKLTF